MCRDVVDSKYQSAHQLEHSTSHSAAVVLEWNLQFQERLCYVQEYRCRDVVYVCERW